jgi:glycerol-3-phosphate O-acyltransferase
VIAYGESMKVLTRQSHKLGDLARIPDAGAVLMTYYRNNVLHLFALPFTAMEVATRTYLDTFREVIR